MSSFFNSHTRIAKIGIAYSIRKNAPVRGEVYDWMYSSGAKEIMVAPDRAISIVRGSSATADIESTHSEVSFEATISLSSPDWYISIAMSEPPISSPLMKI